MAISYKKLWKLLIDKDMMKKDLRAMTQESAPQRCLDYQKMKMLVLKLCRKFVLY